MMIPENAEMIGTLQAYRTGQDPGGLTTLALRRGPLLAAAWSAELDSACGSSFCLLHIR